MAGEDSKVFWEMGNVESKKMKILLLILAMFFLTGCGRFGRFWAGLTGEYESCVDGVTYLQFSSGVTVKYQPDGKIATCE